MTPEKRSGAPVRLGAEAARDAVDRLARLAGVLSEGGRGWDGAAIAALAARPGGIVVAATDALLLAQAAGGEAEILDLGVRQTARRRGLGRRLLAAGEDAARAEGAARMLLEVAEDNSAARALYAAASYAPVGRRRGYYARPGAAPADALILARGLD